MSMPQIPTVVAGTININRQNVINLLLASIAMEELSMAHIMNAEAEKIQAVLGTLPGGPSSVQAATFGDLLTIDRSVSSILRGVIKKDMLLQFKLEDIISILTPPPPPPGTCSITIIPPPECPTAENPCPNYTLNGVVQCSGIELPNEVSFTYTVDAGTLSGTLTIPNAPINPNGSYQSSFIVPSGSVAMISVTATTNVNGQVVSVKTVSFPVSCP